MTYPELLDSVRFERLVAEGRSLAETDPPAASLVLSEALALWRGRAFEDFTYESFAQAEIARLEELRMEAVGARIDGDLDGEPQQRPRNPRLAPHEFFEGSRPTMRS